MTVDIVKMGFSVILILIGAVWTVTLAQIRADIKEIKKGLRRHGDDIDRLKRFAVQVKAVHNINHPDHTINGLQ